MMLRLDVASMAAQDTSAARGADSLSVVAQPEMRTPQNVGYLQAAYVAAGIVYITYLVILRRRWQALKARRNRSMPAPGR